MPFRRNEPFQILPDGMDEPKEATAVGVWDRLKGVSGIFGVGAENKFVIVESTTFAASLVLEEKLYVGEEVRMTLDVVSDAERWFFASNDRECCLASPASWLPMSVLADGFALLRMFVAALKTDSVLVRFKGDSWKSTVVLCNSPTATDLVTSVMFTTSILMSEIREAFLRCISLCSLTRRGE